MNCVREKWSLNISSKAKEQTANLHDIKSMLTSLPSTKNRELSQCLQEFVVNKANLANYND